MLEGSTCFGLSDMLYEGAAGTVGAIAAEDASLAVSGNGGIVKISFSSAGGTVVRAEVIDGYVGQLSLLPANVNDMTLSLSQYLSALIISASVWLKVSASKEILILELPVLIRCKR